MSPSGEEESPEVPRSLGRSFCQRTCLTGFRSHAHLRIPADVYPTAERAGELVRLLANLPIASRQMLIDALSDSAGRESGFRGLGTANRQWITDAEANAFSFDAWIDPNPKPLKLSKATDALPKNQTVSLTSLPPHVLWMGRPFDSCLDLRGADYCASVVPNFMDANKQLLVILDSDGRMVGRKLLSITPVGGLLGYYLYSATSRSDSQLYEEVCERVTQYCR